MCDFQKYKRIFLFLTAAVASTVLSAAPQLSKRHRSIIEAMDWSHPLLSEVAPAYKARDWARTKKLLADHFRKRGADQSPIEKNPAYKLDKANGVCAGTVDPAHIKYTFAGGKIKWLYNPTKEPGKVFNKEFTVQLNRMLFWKYLGEAYRATGDERYVKAFVEQFRSWLKQAPCPVGNEDGKDVTAWRTIDTGIRLRTSWPDAFYAMGNCKVMTDDDVLDFFASSLEQLRFCLKYPAIGNWMTMQMNGVFRFASSWPEIKETAAARKKALEVMSAGFKDQILPDGFQNELTPMYHNVAVGNTLNLVHTAYQSGFKDSVPQDLIALLEKSHEALVAIMTPAGSIPLFNDSGPGDLASRYRGKLLEIYPQNQLFRWIATEGKAGKAPEYVSTILPWAGYIAMRQSWDKKANLLIFDVGMPGKSHIHQDKLHFTLYSGKEELIFDDGGGSYAKSKFRKYSLSAYSHNTCVIDGKDQLRDTSDRTKCVPKAPVPCTFVTEKDFDFAEASYNEGFGEGNNRIATHTRQILYIKPDIYVVYDRLTPNDGKKHSYQLRFQVRNPRLKPLFKDHKALRTERGRHAELVISPLLSKDMKSRFVVNDKETPLGIRSDKKGRVNAAATVLYEKQGSGVQEFMTLLLPIKPKSKPLRSITEDGRNAKIVFADGRTLQIKAPEKGGRIQYVWEK